MTVSVPEGVSYETALAQLTGPGAPFELTEAPVGEQVYTVFKATPPNLRTVFATARARSEDEIFLVYEDERWSFPKVMQQVDGIAAALVHEYGVQRGDRVAIAMRNYPEWVMSFAAITSIGGIAVAMNAWWTADEMDYGLEDSGAKVLICDTERLERATASMARLGVKAIVVRSEGAALPEGAARYEDAVQVGQPMPEVEVAPEDDATILYTSGTTGRPKGAVSTNRAVMSALTAYACRATVRRLMEPHENEHPYPNAFILAIPLFHVTGLVPIMLSCFAGGAKLVIMYKWNPERALELIERERVTLFVGVPTMSWDLLESPDFEKRDTSSLLSVGGGGAPAPPELVKRIDKGFRKANPNIGYGMTETNAYGPQNMGDDYLKRPTSAGRVLPMVQMQVIDGNGDPLPTGELGEICFRGPNVIRGYWNKPEATAETIVDGWLRSGDLGRIDEEGFVYVVDRAKDMVLRGGENIYCAEVEAAIYEHPAIYEAAVFGLPHTRLGEEVACAIVLKEGASLALDELRAHVAERLAAFKVPSTIEVRGEQLPRNASGKILKRALRDEMAARGGA